ncbi:MAG: Hpt domain-containing protein, partial [Rhodanobacter sp.]
MDAEFDLELRQDFLVEAGELLQRLGEQLVALETSPRDSELLNAVFRAFHTVKGGAGFLALEPMVLLCHHAEDLLNEARNGKVALDAAHMDGLLQALDLLNDMMAAVGEGSAMAMPPPDLLQALTPRDAKPAPVAAPAPAAAAEAGAIDDNEFEALLDTLYGTAAPGTVAPAPLPTAPPAGIDDDEFEALLDSLHGKPGQPAAPAPAPAPAAAPASATP